MAVAVYIESINHHREFLWMPERKNEEEKRFLFCISNRFILCFDVIKIDIMKHKICFSVSISSGQSLISQII